MNLLLLIALLVTITYLGGVYLFGKRGRFGFYTAGIEFLLLGAILGSDLLFPSPVWVTKSLQPFVHVELGLIGLLYGIQFEWRTLRRLPRGDWGMMWFKSLLTMTAVFMLAWICLDLCRDAPFRELIPAVLIFAAAALLSSSWTGGVIYNIFRVRTHLVRRLFFISVLDDSPGLVLFSAVFFFFPSGSFTDTVLRICGATLAGLILGSIIKGLLRGKRERGQALVIIIGSILLASGVAYSIGVSVIYITILSGVVIANTRPRLRDIYPAIAGAEHPLYLLFLVFAGALWNPANITALGIACVLVATRYAAKWSAFELSKGFVDIPSWSGRLAMALISPGGMSVAMVINFALFSDRFELAQLVLDVTVWALIILSPLGVTLAKKALLVPEAGT